MEVYSNDKPGLKRGQISSKERKRRRKQKKVNRRASKGKIVGNVQQGTNKDTGEAIRRKNALIRKQMKAAVNTRGDRNVGNVLKGLEAMLAKEPPMIPTGAVGNSYKTTNRKRKQ